MVEALDGPQDVLAVVQRNLANAFAFPSERVFPKLFHLPVLVFIFVLFHESHVLEDLSHLVEVDGHITLFVVAQVSGHALKIAVEPVMQNDV